MAEEMELKSAPTAVPASASFTGVSPPFDIVPTPNTIEAPSAAPTNDQRINVKEDWPGKNANAMAIANAEPFVTPIISGDASAFLVIPCIMAPDTAKKAPTRAAPTVRGSLNSRMI